MEFGVDLDQTAVDLWVEMMRNFHDNPCHIFYRATHNVYDYTIKIGKNVESDGERIIL